MDYTPVLAKFKIEALNPMQVETIAAIEQKDDVVLISPTGSGKTLAFLLPLLGMLKPVAGIQVVILVPTRELAIQIEQVFKQITTQYKINCCYGGHSVRIEKNNLSQPPAVLVGTPGRIAYHIEHANVEVNKAHTLILDEFDKSLQAGFDFDMTYIVRMLKQLSKRVLTSATPMAEMPAFITLHRPTTLDYTGKSEEAKPSQLEIKVIRLSEDVDKLEGLLLLISKLGAKSKIVFCNHRDAVKRISLQLEKLRIAHGLYHGEMDQIDREKTLIKLRNGSTNLLITTDLASRGLDIPEIEAVIHYQLPTTEDSMVHRNGRTARMHASGTAYLLLEEKDYVPRFLTVEPQEESLPAKFVSPPPSEWKTLYINAGKKDKVNKIDIVGTLLQKGGLQKDELGRIEVLDNSAYAAIKADKIDAALRLIKEEKIKGKKMKYEIAN